eukprot:550107-Hanusia_phi.AAC.1
MPAAMGQRERVQEGAATEGDQTAPSCEPLRSLRLALGSCAGQVLKARLADACHDGVVCRVPVYDASADVVGRRAVHTAIATNGVRDSLGISLLPLLSPPSPTLTRAQIVLVSKLVAFVYTGSASGRCMA